jgi:hypothetical protein
LSDTGICITDLLSLPHMLDATAAAYMQSSFTAFAQQLQEQQICNEK